jgi:hypothetical protein
MAPNYGNRQIERMVEDTLQVACISFLKFQPGEAGGSGPPVAPDG